MPGPPTSPDFAAVAALVGQKVRAARRDLGLSQEELGIRAGLDRKSVQNIEYGRASTKGVDGEYGPGNPKLDAIWSLSRVLEVGIDYLVDPQQPVRTAAR